MREHLSPRMHVGCGLALALMTAHAAAGTDGNLLPNGDFSQQNQITGWSCLGGSWSSDDATAIAGSGSLWLQNSFNTPGQCTSACIAVRPGAAYHLGGQSRILFGTPVITFACASAGTQCNSFTYDVQGPAMSTSSAWTAPASASGFLNYGALTVKCTVTLGSQDLGNISGHFDNLFFTTDVIFFQGFESQ